MARAIDWTRYDQLKAQGHSEREIARALEIPRTTLQRALQRHERPPSTIHDTARDRPRSTVPRPPPTVDHAPSTVHRLQADLNTALAAALQPVLARLDALETGLAQRSPEEPPSTVHGSSVHGPPSQRDTSTVHPARVDRDAWELRQLKHAERWTIYVPRTMKEELKRRAAARGQNPSILVQEALRRYLAEETPS